MRLNDILNNRIAILDGAMGTMIQQYGLTETDFRGTRFADCKVAQRGNNDILCLTRRDIITTIHEAYLDAGADIIETNSFNANRISMNDYDMCEYVSEINRTAARIAREVADKYTQMTPLKPRFVAGSVGPTNKTCSMSPDVNNPAYRAVTFDEMEMAYYEQMVALIEGGVDLLLIETIFDTLNTKAALIAAEKAMQTTGQKIPIMLSVTLSEGGRTLSGQTLEAFIASIQHFPILTVGLNCSFGARDMKAYLKQLAQIAPYYISAYPNAGLPNRFGQYDETPEMMASQLQEYVNEGLVNIIGGCCGTTPAHIAAISRIADKALPHYPITRRECLTLSGLEALQIVPENNFINIGERCNVAGSRKFLRLISEKKYNEALDIARKQVDDGAQIIDINMDDAMLDAENEMVTFLNLIASEPDICRVPIMIDSSKWNVIESGLKCVQGKGVVNSISLKEGEEKFIAHAKYIHSMGAAMVIMAFDEEGQADTFERKTAICSRAYDLLTNNGISPNDIIFDPNVLALATGIDAHAYYGIDFIRATAWIKENLPGAKVSGGISNLSFSFRGNNYIREAMHAVFLYHAINAGMDMAIVNPSAKVTYTDIPEKLLICIEDVIFNRRTDATDRLIEIAEQIKGENTQTQEVKVDIRDTMTLDERLQYALLKGVSDRLEHDLQEALSLYGDAVSIIEGPLMTGMDKVGKLFGEGKMFLPQVVKTARTMKQAVAILKPYIESQNKNSNSAGKFVLATVKGDVHDIGKNIVSVVLACNNYDIIDLGVMVPTETIIETALREKADIIAVSGLITPSLDEMCRIADAMESAGMKIPLMVGGATTSKLHTAVKIAPRYSGPVIHTRDAAQMPIIAARWLNQNMRKALIDEIHTEQNILRQSLESTTSLVDFSTANNSRLMIDWKSYRPTCPIEKGKVHGQKISIQDICAYINWKYFLHTWKMTGSNHPNHCDCISRKNTYTSVYPDSTETSRTDETQKLLDDAHRMLHEIVKQEKQYYLQARYGIFSANSQGNNIVLHNDEDIIIPCLRQQQAKENGEYLALSDFVMPESEERTDYVGTFVISVCKAFTAEIERYNSLGDTYNALLLQSLCDRLVEAAGEWLHYQIRTRYWGYSPMEKAHIPSLLAQHYQGIRPAVGYPSLPDQSLVFDMNRLLDFAQIDISVTENGAMYPNATITGLYIAHPQSTYFHIGSIDDEQRNQYCKYRGFSHEECLKWLSV